MRKNILIIGIVFSTFLIVLANYFTGHDPYTHLWFLNLIPILLIILYYSSWKTTIITVIIFEGIKYGLELYNYQGEIPQNYMLRLIEGSIISGVIYFLVTLYRIKYDQMYKKVQQLTLVDQLTGIYNRRYFDLYMEKSIPYSQMVNSTLILVLIDIDHFKKINDRYGHLCGDEALKHVSTIIKNNVRSSDMYVRLGGEEFAVALPTTELMEGQIIAQRIRTAVEKSNFVYKNEIIKFTISLGLTIYNGEDIEGFIEKADNALYQAKENGRNQVVISTE